MQATDRHIDWSSRKNEAKRREQGEHAQRKTLLIGPCILSAKITTCHPYSLVRYCFLVRCNIHIHHSLFASCRFVFTLSFFIYILFVFDIVLFTFCVCASLSSKYLWEQVRTFCTFILKNRIEFHFF